MLYPFRLMSDTHGLLSVRTLVNKHLHHNTPVFGTTLCGFIGSRRIGFAHNAWSHDVPQWNVAGLLEIGDDILRAVLTQFLVVFGVSRRICVASYLNYVTLETACFLR